MDIEKTPDTVSRPVEIVQTLRPEELSGENVELEACRGFRENGPVDSDMAL